MTVRFPVLAACLIAFAGAPLMALAQLMPPILDPGEPPPGVPAPEPGSPGPGRNPPPAPDPGTPLPQREPSSYWGALAFTADGSWSSAWRMPSKAEAEARVAVACAKFGRGKCEVVSFPGELCVGLATFIGTSGRRRWRLSFTAGGTTTPAAQKAAIDRCNADKRTRQRCQLRTVVCGDGR